MTIKTGDVMEAAVIGLVLGDTIRTWTDGGTQMWRTNDGGLLRQLSGQGLLARTSVAPGRFREVIMLHQASGTAILQPRFPDKVESDDRFSFAGTMLEMTPAAPTGPVASDDLESAIANAITFAAAAGNVLWVTAGGWDFSPPGVAFWRDGPMATTGTLQATPPPQTEFWAQRVQPGGTQAAAGLRLTKDSLSAAVAVVIDALTSWELDPRTLAFTTAPQSALTESSAAPPTQVRMPSSPTGRTHAPPLGRTQGKAEGRVKPPATVDEPKAASGHLGTEALLPAPPPSGGSTQFTGTVAGFKRFTGPHWRVLVQQLTKAHKAEVAQCQHCGTDQGPLEAAHIHGRERITILHELLGSAVGSASISVDLVEFEQRFRAEHNPIEKAILVLCTDCHQKYDAPFASARPVAPKGSVVATATAADATTLPISLNPPGAKKFKEALLQTRRAEIETMYEDGHSEVTLWKADKFTESSNVIGNLRGRPQFRSGNWRQAGLVAVKVTVVEDNP